MKPLSDRLGRILTVARIFVLKDWVELMWPIAVLTGSLLVPVGMLILEWGSIDVAKGMVAGLAMAAPFVYAQSCFHSERQHGTLDFLLALPLRPFDLVLGKYASLFSMVLFTCAVPSALLRDPGLMFFASAMSLFLAALFMAATVISSRPWAPQLPLWAVILLTLPLRGKLGLYMPALNPMVLALTAFALTPVIMLLSAWIFARSSASSR